MKNKFIQLVFFTLSFFFVKNITAQCPVAVCNATLDVYLDASGAASISPTDIESEPIQPKVSVTSNQ